MSMPDDADTEFTPFPVCPHCGHKHDDHDDWKWDSDFLTGLICDLCGKEFSCEKHTIVRYTTAIE